ncbi:MAG TPA: hypothetical protein VK722_04430 [Candidatus Aquilonibacter sp.]|jgi:hypothetical protein|nr:hypothetical protein [Candidatus Aquilonibacter sp.]
MPRIQFIELHEQPWFPSSLRADVTDALQFGFNLLHAYEPIAPLLQSVIDSTEYQPNAGQSLTTPPATQSIVDMCSGGGGPWLDLSRKLTCAKAENSAGLQIWLTDKYPNLDAFQSVSASSDHHITFYPEPVDAMKVPGALKGLRTMFTSFHHFPPEDARAILQNAVDAGESIGIFEATKRAPSTIGLIFVGILLMFLHTPRIRPFRWSRLLWTYLIPIIPFVLLFDGVVSCLRTYRPQELREIVGKLTACEYQWEIGELAGGKMPVTYLIGYPKMGPCS